MSLFKHCSIIFERIHLFMTTMYPSSDGFFQQDNAPCNKTEVKGRTHKEIKKTFLTYLEVSMSAAKLHQREST